MKNTLEFITQGVEVKRYHTLTTIQTETVGHHSHGVAMLLLLMYPDASRNAIIAALTHDLAEHLIGDIPSPSKRRFGIGDEVNRIEAELLEDSGLPMAALTEEESRQLKLADIAQGALFCAREVQLGNSRIRHVLNRYMAYADEQVLTTTERDLFKQIKWMAS
jgi:5'-deoxynucleotidase YfbR-like HD superfamily hydrolase